MDIEPTLKSLLDERARRVKKKEKKSFCECDHCSNQMFESIVTKLGTHVLWRKSLIEFVNGQNR